MTVLRLSEEQDIPQIMRIVASAQAYLAAQGIDQWQNGYPNEAVVRSDIEKAYGYVLEEDGRVTGIASLVFDGEPTYEVIYDGAWRTCGHYACIHRIAVDGSQRGKGTADCLMQGLERLVILEGLDAIRVDTHRQNVVMQGMLARNEYVLCGVIRLQDGAERLAFEKQV